MTVHVIIPVFNRLALSQALVACLRRQSLNQPLRILMVDDGSSDGTAEWLMKQDDIEVLNGNGSLFWGGAVDLAVRHIQARASAEDWVLLMNNDTTVADDFVQRLLDTARAQAPAAVGSVIREESDGRLLSVGVRVDAWRLLTRDLLDRAGPQPVSDAAVEVDVLSGRGVLFPMAGLLAAGGMRPGVLPHYLADYEVSLRVRKSGWRLLVQPAAAVYSSADFGSARGALSWREKLFSVRSPLYLPASLAFWWEASNWLQRLTLPLRLLLFILFPRLRKPQT